MELFLFGALNFVYALWGRLRLGIMVYLACCFVGACRVLRQFSVGKANTAKIG